MNYKEDNEKDRIALFKYCLDLNMPEQKKKKVFKYLYEEFRDNSKFLLTFLCFINYVC